jgi:bifunctional ADP-heptose synthase (sugar kinase/adenylyltransferase)
VRGGGLRGDGRRRAQIRRELAQLDGGRVLARLVERPDRPTTTKTRVVARQQQVVRFDRERDDDLPDECAAELCEHVRAAVAACDALVLEDYNKGVLGPAVIHTALEAADAAGIPSVVDPKFRNFFGFYGATVFKPNAVELGTAMASPVRAGDDDWLENARIRPAPPTSSSPWARTGWRSAPRGAARSASPPWRARCTTFPARATR